MNRFIRYWNKNRKNILIAILIVVFAIIITKIINHIFSKQLVEGPEKVNTTVGASNLPTQSVITGEVLPYETTNSNTNIIKQFVDLCNSNNYQEAYNLLSSDCKSELFSTLDEFKVNYFDKIFDTEKTYELELWYSKSGNYTYRILYYENNILSTGKIDTSNNIQDYITITIDNMENLERKINISGFISKDIINKNTVLSDLEIIVNNKSTFYSYERYNITIKNNTNQTIILSKEANGQDICLVDENEVEYDSILNEIPLTDLQVDPNSTKTINIKFNNLYGESRKIEQILFKNIILNIDNISNMRLSVFI